jgi:hypothetical protein
VEAIPSCLRHLDLERNSGDGSNTQRLRNATSLDHDLEAAGIPKVAAWESIQNWRSGWDSNPNMKHQGIHQVADSLGRVPDCIPKQRKDISQRVNYPKMTTAGQMQSRQIS